MNRRRFLQCLALLPGTVSLRATNRLPMTRYVGQGNQVLVITSKAGKARLLQTVASERPAALELSPDGRILFVVNEVPEFEGTPNGSVESFAVDDATGMLTPINRQRLSLSSTLPRHCAVSPDGRYLVVAAYGGGTYNVLPLLAGGKVGPVHQVIKEVGHGLDPIEQATAHPHSVLFHPSGRFVLGTDFGCDRVNVFGFKEGTLTRIQRSITAPGTGPAEMTMNAAGESLTVKYQLKPSRAQYRFQAQTGHLQLVVRTDL